MGMSPVIPSAVVPPRLLRIARELLDSIQYLETCFETELAVLKDRAYLFIREAECVANGAARDEVKGLRKLSRMRELGLRLRAGDPRAARSMLQRQRALKSVEKMRAAGFPNLQAARAAKAAKAAGRRAREGPG
jgi:hypothetical protein